MTTIENNTSTQSESKPEDQPGSPTSSEHTTMRHSPSNTTTQNNLIQTILARHSTRVFLQDLPVPQSVVEDCLALAQHSPSSTNVQPWRLTFTAGAKLESLRKAMMDAVLSGQKSTVPPMPDDFKKYRSELGHILYGPEGYNISREDREGTRKAQLRNYEFFGAPMVATIGIDESLLRGSDVMSVGLYIQTLVLLLTERGLGTCLQVSSSGYGDVLKRELGIPDNIHILSTLAIGYEDKSKMVNTFKMPRDQWRDHVNFVME